MRNAEEHKNFLAQIAELEKGSINYFDVEKEFFLIDSNNLSQVRPKLYGYSIQAGGIYEDDNLTPEAVKNLDGRGCYVYVDVRDGKITIKQDLNGCWGIYLFRHGDYFALSNSFFRLLDYVKNYYPLTVNRDYCHYLIASVFVTLAYSETAVNEIQLVDRSAILQIDINKKTLETELIDYKEQTVSLDTEEGIATLDRWVEFWSSVMCGLAQNTPFVKVDLSGGFDSRVSFVFALNSGIDLNRIQIYSVEDDLHDHDVDFKIASQIAAHYGFKLNKPFPERQWLNRSISDIFNLDLYHRRTAHTDDTLTNTQKPIEKFYSLGGVGGETIRNYWYSSPTEFIKNQTGRTKIYSPCLSFEMSRSIKKILDSSFLAICDKYKIEDNSSTDIPQLLYNETRSRYHFGRHPLGNYFKNMFNICPALDPDVRKLQLNTPECPDYNLLITLLFVRYAPYLLEVPFQGNRSITPETIEYAKKLNEKFPLSVKHGKQSENRGGIIICRRVINMRKKFLLWIKTTKKFPAKSWRII